MVKTSDGSETDYFKKDPKINNRCCLSFKSVSMVVLPILYGQRVHTVRTVLTGPGPPQPHMEKNKLVEGLILSHHQCFNVKFASLLSPCISIKAGMYARVSIFVNSEYPLCI